MKTIRKIDDLAGILCNALIPVRNPVVFGHGSDIAICTLSSTKLLVEIRNSDVRNSIAIAARLLTENKGIDEIIKYADSNSDLKHIIVCGNEVKGHLPGQALLSLQSFGVDSSGKIIGADGQYPTLKSSKISIEKFRKRINIIDMRGVDSIDAIRLSVIKLVNKGRGFQ